MPTDRKEGGGLLHTEWAHWDHHALCRTIITPHTKTRLTHLTLTPSKDTPHTLKPHTRQTVTTPSHRHTQLEMGWSFRHTDTEESRAIFAFTKTPLFCCAQPTNQSNARIQESFVFASTITLSFHTKAQLNPPKWLHNNKSSAPVCSHDHFSQLRPVS